MPDATAARRLDADPGAIWKVVADPAHLPRWWPRTVRVENSAGTGHRARWTQVMESSRGVPVRADYRCTEASEPRRLLWEQEVEGTPFERLFRQNRLEILLEADGSGTQVTLQSHQKLRGLSRLGGVMAARATRRLLGQALAGLERALGGPPASGQADRGG